MAIRAHSGSSASPWKFTGEQHEGAAGDTGYYFLRARYYDVNLGRFISRDPIEFDQRYAYAGGNPVRYSDASGLEGDDQSWCTYATGLNNRCSYDSNWDSTPFTGQHDLRVPINQIQLAQQASAGLAARVCPVAFTAPTAAACGAALGATMVLREVRSSMLADQLESGELSACEANAKETSWAIPPPGLAQGTEKLLSSRCPQRPTIANQSPAPMQTVSPKE